MSVRAAAPTDVPALTRLNRAVQEIHHEAEPGRYKVPSAEGVEAWFREVLSRQETRAFVAEEEGVAVGYLLAALRERPEDPFARARRWLHIDHISVDPACQRRGHGRALVAAALECARVTGVRDVEAGVMAFNEPSLRFFERLGFRQSALRLRTDVD